MFNIDVAVATLAEIEITQEIDDALAAWDQHTWGSFKGSELANNPHLIVEEDPIEGERVVGYGTCGTAMCCAGWALTIARVPMKWTKVSEAYGGEYTAHYTAEGRPISEVGTELLGIDKAEARELGLWSEGDDMPELFIGDNSLNDLYRLVAAHEGCSEEMLHEMVASHRATIRVEERRKRSTPDPNPDERMPF